MAGLNESDRVAAALARREAIAAAMQQQSKDVTRIRTGLSNFSSRNQDIKPRTAAIQQGYQGRYAPSPSQPAPQRPVEVRRAAQRLLTPEVEAAQQGAYQGARGATTTVPAALPAATPVPQGRAIVPFQEPGVPAVGANSGPTVIRTGDRVRVPSRPPVVIDGQASVVPRSVERPYSAGSDGVKVGSSDPVAPGRQMAPLQTPTATPPPPANAWSQTLADKSIANRFQATNKAEAARATQAAAPVQPSPTRTPIATRAAHLNAQAGRFLPALEIGRGAWQTGKDIKERTSNGQGFWSAVGDTITGNIRKAADLTQGGTVEQLNAIAAEKQAPGSDTAVAAQQAFTDKQARQPALGAMVDVVKPAPVVAPAAPAPSPVAPTAPTSAPDATPAQKFASQQIALGRQDLNAPGQESSGTFRGATNVTPRPGSAPPNDVIAFQGQRQSVYNDTQKDMIAAQENARRNLGNADAARKMQAAEAANEQARQKVLAGQGPLERVTYNRQNGEASGIREAGAPRGGLSGADTDAEAARNIQSRLEQDAAASQVVASMNRGAEAERDTRAAKLGISRGVLDQMEGRMDSPAVQALQERQNAQKPYEAMEQAQSAYRNEQAAIERMRSGAPRGRPGDRVKREAVYKEADARAAAAENMLNAGLGVGKQRLDAETARQQARANAQAAQFQEEGQNRRADLSARTQLGTTALAQQGQNQRAQMEAQQKAEEKAFDRLGDKWKTARDMFKEDYDKQAFSAFAASPELPQILAGMGYDTEAKRAQFLTNPDENQVNEMVRIYNANKGNTGSWFFGVGKKTPKELGETLKR